MNIDDRRMLTGDNFNVPNVGLKGTVVRIGFHGYVRILWDDGTLGWFSPYQVIKWTVRIQ